jgi:hypothetical protein
MGVLLSFLPTKLRVRCRCYPKTGSGLMRTQFKVLIIPILPPQRPADDMAGCFVVNIGDMMEVWTNGLWNSTKHRVVHKTGGYRVSVPFFYEPNWDAVVKPLDKCVEMTGGMPRYAEKVYWEHLVEKVSGNFYSETEDTR